MQASGTALLSDGPVQQHGPHAAERATERIRRGLLFHFRLKLRAIFVAVPHSDNSIISADLGCFATGRWREKWT